MSELIEEIRHLQAAIATLTGVVQSLASAQQTPATSGIDMSEDEEIAYVLQHNIDPLIYLKERRERQNASKQQGKKPCKSSKTSRPGSSVA
ncbi:MAG: hypothetical protein ACOYB1_18525 [Limnohabitans sp.]